MGSFQFASDAQRCRILCWPVVLKPTKWLLGTVVKRIRIFRDPRRRASVSQLYQSRINHLPSGDRASARLPDVFFVPVRNMEYHMHRSQPQPETRSTTSRLSALPLTEMMTVSRLGWRQFKPTRFIPNHNYGE